MNTTKYYIVALILAAMGMQDIAMADPPEWAPAHGWRKKHERDRDDDHHGRKHRREREREVRSTRYSDYDRNPWPSDYGVVYGDCDRRAIGAVLGGVVGGVVGSRVGSDGDRRVAILLGSVIGAVIGAEIGRRMDEQDRACMGHALELAEGGRPVTWRNETSQATYILTPLQVFHRNEQPCRNFSLEVRTGGRTDVSHQKACRGAAGRWELMG
ncbi:MAG: glycine zipper domain-containing protein [Burkholderiales bacterium]